ncbi:peptidoglycan/LPS O-acetylase OafA/YrhL [Mucilaginibacter frigoritolerans]|uniref:Peptidoglycan/LPS O-acetylase OafA/YrhL n=1 Tax=Mucilaginibacter frigoritolerans TaxID=652788 RepID=A0A562U0R9_9SPHI|nr:acyltransferase [Mucilaginibacter frigoritolerans]TWI99283.1 peptidoglycan/LPS O-acetylase OafA/YrhL [Mucilaginibacter frigoritolerans]
MADAPVHFKKIDFLRGIAILLVFCYHSQIAIFHFEVNDYNSYGILNTLSRKSAILNYLPTAFGWSGVELFLLISGFLIHFGFLSKGSVFKAGDFFSRRFWRIYPPYLLVLLVLCCINANGIHYYLLSKDGLADLFAHLFLLHNIFDKTFFTVNNSFWSLALEAQLYVLYPVILYVRKLIGINKTLLLVIILSLLLLGIGIMIPALGKSLYYANSVFRLWFVWVAGAFLAEKIFNKERLFNKGTVAIMLGLVLLTIASRALLMGSYFTVYFATFGFFVFFEWFLLNEKISIGKRYFKLISLIGLCSYSIYLIHQPYLNQLFNGVSFGYYNHFYLLLPFKLIAMFGVIFAIAYVLYLYVELQSIKLGQIIRNKKKQPHTHAALPDGIK